MKDLGALAFLLFAIALTAFLLSQEKRPEPVIVPYCQIAMHAAGKDPVTGEWLTGWVQGYGPCSQQDIYRQI